MNYKETTATGTRYTRCNGVNIRNPINQQAEVYFSEESVVELDDGTVVATQAPANLSYAFNQADPLEVINPLTMEPTGVVMNYGEVYAILYSAYLARAKQRDIEQAPVPEPDAAEPEVPDAE